VVVRLAPFQRTIDPVMKLVPFTVRVNAGPPAVAEVGLKLVVVGTGLPVNGEGLSVRGPPPGRDEHGHRRRAGRGDVAGRDRGGELSGGDEGGGAIGAVSSARSTRP